MDMVISSANGDYERVRNMLIRGEDANSTDYTGCSALYMAATNRKPEVVELLLKAGANINLRDKNVSNLMTLFPFFVYFFFIVR